MTDFKTYLSPFSWRYGSAEMRKIWSEHEKRRLWRELWVVLAEVQSEYGLVRQDQVEELRARMEDIDLNRSLEIEAEIHHDLMAELKAFAEQCPAGGGALHQGATSMDIEDNADVLRMRRSLDLVLVRLRSLLEVLANLVDRWADLPIIAFTHLQPAEPSTLGYRLAQYAQDLLLDLDQLEQARSELRGKGFKGAVGTAAAYGELLGVNNLARFEDLISERIDLPFFPAATQVYPRKQDYRVLCALAGLGGSLYKFAFDLRLLQSPPVGEWMEPFGQKQVGSSAMPFKRNPIMSEKIDSLARALAQMPRLAWDNASHSLLERTLDDSANRRSLLPEAFLNSDELLIMALKIVQGLHVNEGAIARNLSTYGPYAATERVLMALSKAGADRQVMHERLRSHAMTAWGAVQQGEPNPLERLIVEDKEFGRFLDIETLKNLMNAGEHIGYAPSRARGLAVTIREKISSAST
jgi:adenylosuccinate lyase